MNFSDELIKLKGMIHNSHQDSNVVKQLVESLNRYLIEMQAELGEICMEYDFDLNEIYKSKILSVKNIRDMTALCQFSSNQKWKLVYQASVDGFSAKNFHDYCDGLKHTLTIVKTTRGYIFGGYTDEAWNSHNEYVKDPNAFIFSLINPSHSPQLIKCSEPDYAIYCGLNYGPSFGYSCSLYLSDFSNLNTLSVSDLSYNYKHPDFESNSNEATTFLAGSTNFETVELEVFQLI